ncbi:MAG: hypothetical protein CBC29_05925 [Methylococcaceae bacterium TMED69]|nr:MAG: hypothetical protein CBC29_05925 [Methylococcaceae bacterium TMED69]|tara:strand:+ start:1629 stop:2099 length:471 start_codon:yes stop_codon:yes gene_type:complete
MAGVKHLIECHCVLPQFRNNLKNTQYHKFKVFSTYDQTGAIIPKFSACNNCGVIHKVIDICKSEIQVGKDSGAVIGIDDCALLIPESILNILQNYSCELPDYEHAIDILQNEDWGQHIIVNRDESDDGNEQFGKILKFNGPGKYSIEPFTIKRVLQ